MKCTIQSFMGKRGEGSFVVESPKAKVFAFFNCTTNNGK